MSLLSAFFFCFSFLLAASTPLQAGSDVGANQWQEGELVSRRTVLAGHHGIHYKYVYRVRSGDARYLVVSREPLKLDLLVPMKFTPVRHHLVIQDSDGREYKVSMVERGHSAFAPWR